MQKIRHKRKLGSKGHYANTKGLSPKVAAVASQFARTDIPSISAGDHLKIHCKIMEGEKSRIQIYEGNLLRVRKSQGHQSLTVRKISHGVGVERTFLTCSPVVAKIEVVSKGKVRRAKLYYLRELDGKAARIDQKIQKASEKSDSSES
jgi:large subunit ribosomal protein L19